MRTTTPAIEDALEGSGIVPAVDEVSEGSAIVPAVEDRREGSGIREQDLQPQERFEDELIMHLERDQFVAETSRPVPPALLSARARAGLWALRVFVMLVSLMVIYAFIDALH